MNVSRTGGAVGADRERAERLEIARRLYQALAVQHPDRVIILRDTSGRVVAHHDLRPEAADTAS
jgi:hypothetical protein